MITKTTRPLTAKERAMLTPKALDPAVQAFFLGMFLLIPIMLAYAVLCRFFPNLERLDRMPWAVALGLAPSIYFSSRMYLKEKHRRAKHPDLDSGVAEVTTYDARQAIKVDEFEDEGIGFYIDIGDDKVLFLQGQYLYEDDEEKRFPCTRFTITRTTHSHWVLDMECEGEYLSPVCVNPPFTDKDHKAGLAPEDGEILEAEFERLKKE